MATAYIALGTNLGNLEQNLNNAVAALDRVPGVQVTARSKRYKTEPVGYTEQPDFLNAAVRVETTRSPEALLGACLGIEAAMGRVRTVKNGPRVLDLDLLLYENETRSTAELILPHPRMLERTFVLQPLCDICQEPLYHQKLKELTHAGE